MGKLRKNTALTGGLGDLQTSNVCNKKELGWERGFSIALLLLLWSSIGDRKTKNCEDLLDRSQTFKLVWIFQTNLLQTRYSTDNKILIVIFYYSVLNNVVIIYYREISQICAEEYFPGKGVLVQQFLRMYKNIIFSTRIFALETAR